MRAGTARVAVLALATLPVAAACGRTYVEESADTTIVTTTTTPVDVDAPIDDLLDQIEVLMSDLDRRIVDQDAQVETMQRIDELWQVAEGRIRSADPDDVFNFEQAIELARSGVDRRRPADASKGYKILTDVVDSYLGRGGA